MEFHPYSEVFPFLEGAALDELVTDIHTNGLRDPIWTYEGQILDGRNRFIACKRSGVKPEFRPYKGKDPLAFVVSVNIHRRHLNESQRAMAAAEIKALTKSANLHSGDRTTTAADSVSVSRRSVFHADKVLESGSKKLKQAVKSGEISVSKAASVVDLPKAEQLAAAIAKPVKEPDEPERPEFDPSEDEKIAAIEKEINASNDKILRADDITAAMHDEIKRQAADNAALKLARDGFMNGKTEITRLLRAEQRKTDKQSRRITELEKENTKLRNELELLRERVAVMDAA